MGLPVMVKRSTMDKYLKELNVLLNNPSKIPAIRKGGAIIPRAKMALFRLNNISEINYLEILKETVKPTDNDLFKLLKRKPNIRAFNRATKCHPNDLVGYGLSILQEDLFTDNTLTRLQANYLRDQKLRLKELDKFEDEKDKWQVEFDKWEKIADNPEEMPNPPKDPLELLDDDLDPIEYLLIVLKENGFRIDKTIQQKLINKEITDDQKIQSTIHLDLCINSSFNDLLKYYPNVAQKVLSNTLRQKRSKRR